MLPEFETTIYDSERVDALTVTSKSVAGRALIMGLYKNFVEESNSLGFEKAFKSLGYKGYQCESVRWGTRLDGSALFSSGDDAMKITHMLLHDLDYDNVKTTRVDLCVDIALTKPSRGWLRSLRENEEFQAVQNKANRKTTVIESDTGDTLYIGSRVSGRFGRIYDKSLAYGVDLGYVYRFELETKKQVAPAVFKRLFPEKEDSTFSWDCFSDRVRGIIQTQFSQWGLNLNLSSSQKEKIKAELRVSTIDTQLEYLSRSVAPMLVRLERAGYQQQAFEALGIVTEVMP
jgi:DNA relaxase NicK